MLISIVCNCTTTESPKKFIEPKSDYNQHNEIVYSSEELEVREIHALFKLHDYNSIASKIIGYYRVNNLDVVRKLVATEESVSIIILGSLVATNNRDLFNLVYKTITTNRVLPYSIENRLRNLRIAWDNCNQLLPDAMISYYNNNAKLDSVKGYINMCKELGPVFYGYRP